MKKIDFEILRFLYYKLEVQSRYLSGARNQMNAIKAAVNELGCKESLATMFVAKIVQGTIPLDLVLRARYNFVKGAKELSKNVALYQTINGKVFAVFARDRVIRHFKQGGPLIELQCTPDLAVTVCRGLKETFDPQLKEYGFSIEKLQAFSAFEFETGGNMNG